MINTFIKTALLSSALIATVFAGELTLENALKEGLSNNYDIRLEKINETTKDNNTIMGTGYLLPTVSLTSGAQYQDVEDLIDENNYAGTSLTAGASANWTLFDGFRMFYARSLIYNQADQAKVAYRVKVETTAISIIQAYYTVLSTNEALSVSEESYAISKRRYNKALHQHELGMLSKRELYSSEIAYNNDKKQLESMKLSSVKSKYYLNYVLGRDITTEVSVTNSKSIDTLSYSKEELFQYCSEKNASLQSLTISKKLAEDLLGISKSAMMPMITATGSYGYLNSTRTYDNTHVEVNTETLTGAVGVNLNWKIFNGFSDKASIKNSKLDVETIEISKEMLLMQMKQSIYSKVFEYENLLNQYDYAKVSAEASEKNMEVSEELFTRGTITDVQFRQSQTEWQNAKYAVISIELQLITLKSEIEKLAGIIQI